MCALCDILGRFTELGLCVDLIAPKAKSFVNDNVPNCHHSLTLIVHLVRGASLKQSSEKDLAGVAAITSLLHGHDFARNENILILLGTAAVAEELAVLLLSTKGTVDPANSLQIDFDLFLVLNQLASAHLILGTKLTQIDQTYQDNIRTLQKHVSFLRSMP
jgi:hypothetical protein